MNLLSQLLVRIILMTSAAFCLASCGQAPEMSPSLKEVASPSPVNVRSSPTAPVAMEGKKSVIVFLGDSLTAGFGLPLNAALPEQVGKRLQKAGLNLKVVNAGVSGDTTANGLARYDWSVKSVDPDYLIIALGANDYLRDIPPETTLSNLTAILNRAKADNIPTILAGLSPRSSTEEGSREADFGAIYPELAKRFDVPLYPALLEGVWDNPNLLQSDGLHPTAKGVEVMADHLTKFLVTQTQAGNAKSENSGSNK